MKRLGLSATDTVIITRTRRLLYRMFRSGVIIKDP